jgi:hypothetical protein
MVPGRKAKLEFEAVYCVPTVQSFKADSARIHLLFMTTIHPIQSVYVWRGRETAAGSELGIEGALWLGWLYRVTSVKIAITSENESIRHDEVLYRSARAPVEICTRVGVGKKFKMRGRRKKEVASRFSRTLNS